MAGNPLKYEIERRVSDPFVSLGISDAGIDLLIYGMVNHHFDAIHPLLGTLSEAMDPSGLDDYILFQRDEPITDEQVASIRETISLPVEWMKDHVAERVDYIRDDQGMVHLNVTMPDFFWLVTAIELMIPMFRPQTIQYDYLTRMADRGQAMFTDEELMAGWALGLDVEEEGGAIQ